MIWVCPELGAQGDKGDKQGKYFVIRDLYLSPSGENCVTTSSGGS